MSWTAFLPVFLLVVSCPFRNIGKCGKACLSVRRYLKIWSLNFEPGPLGAESYLNTCLLFSLSYKHLSSLKICLALIGMEKSQTLCMNIIIYGLSGSKELAFKKKQACITWTFSTFPFPCHKSLVSVELPHFPALISLVVTLCCSLLLCFSLFECWNYACFKSH